MADAVQAGQRNLYQLKFANLEYRNGQGYDYDEQLRMASWPIADDVPQQAQRSAAARIKAGSYSTLHPGLANTSLHQTLPAFSETHGSLGSKVLKSGDPALPVHERLYTPSRATHRPASAPPSSRMEAEGDDAFRDGKFALALSKYTGAINARPTCTALRKRCAASLHMGNYKAALDDARAVAATGQGGPNSVLAVRSIEEYLAASKACAPPARPRPRLSGELMCAHRRAAGASRGTRTRTSHCFAT